MKKYHKIIERVLGGLLAVCMCGAVGCGTSSDSNESSIDGTSGSVARAMRVQAGYDYGLHVQGKASMLYNYCIRFFDIPDTLDCVVAGDVFTVGFSGTGPCYAQETYPSIMCLPGPVTSVEVEKAEIVRLTYYAHYDGEVECDDKVEYDGEEEYFMLERDNGVSERILVASRPDCYITNITDGSFAELSDVFYSKTLFGSYNAEDGYDAKTGYSFAGLYEYNPRYQTREVAAETQVTIEELNANASFAFPLLSNMSDCGLEGYDYVPGFGCEWYENAETGEFYQFSSYPDEANAEYGITSLGKRDFTLFGLSSASATAKEFAEALTTHGYTGTYTETFVTMEKYGVYLRLSYTEEKGWFVKAGVRVTNDTGIIY